jgi:hypothetical protein
VEEELSFREIADVLGLTEETARWRVFKARQKLLSQLALNPEKGTVPLRKEGQSPLRDLEREKS